MAVNDIFSLRMELAIRGKELSVNMGYQQVGGSDAANVAVILMQNYVTGTQVLWTDILATDVTLQCVLVNRVAPSPSIPGSGFFSGVNGSDTGQALPAVSGPAAKWVTLSADAKDNGRKFIPGISEDRLVNGVLTDVFVTTKFQAWATGHGNQILAAAPDDQVFTPCVINRVDAGVPIVPPNAKLLDFVQVNGIINQQLRRKTPRTAIAP